MRRFGLKLKKSAVLFERICWHCYTITVECNIYRTITYFTLRPYHETIIPRIGSFIADVCRRIRRTSLLQNLYLYSQRRSRLYFAPIRKLPFGRFTDHRQIQQHALRCSRFRNARACCRSSVKTSRQRKTCT